MERRQPEDASHRERERILTVIERSERSRYFEHALPVIGSAGAVPSLVTIQPFGPLHRKLAAVGVPSFALGCRTANQYPGAVAKLYRIIRRTNAGVVHTHEPIAGAIAGIASRIAGVKSIYHRHHVRTASRQRVLNKIASRTCDLTVAVSAAAARAAGEDDAVRADQICIAWNGIPDLRAVAGEELKALEQALGIQPHDDVVTAVARLRPEKGLSTLFEAMGRLSPGATPHTTHLVIIGDGPAKGELMRLGKHIGHLTVHFIGHQTDIAPWYQLADVVAVPSISESFGLVAIEAMAAGRAVVASDVGGLAEIIDHGSTGILVPSNSPDSLARGISELLADSSLREELGRAARRRYLESFTVEAMVSRWTSCYAKALEGAGTVATAELSA
jgi:glycosyltransferase involved in cell wall biosynthesis